MASWGMAVTRRRPRSASLASLAARARMAAGLSQRALAKLAGVSNSTLAELERGEDARWDTLRSIGAVLPGLSAASALNARSRHPPQASSAAVATLRGVLGIGCESLRLRLDAGEARVEMEVRGVMIDGADPVDGTDDTQVVTALMRAACDGSARFRRELEGAALLEAGGSLQLMVDAIEHRFTLRAGKRRCLDHSRVGRGGPDAENSERDPGAPSIRHQSMLPTRELCLELNVPGAAASLRPELRAWMVSSMRAPAESDLARRLHPGRVGLRLKRLGDLSRAVITSPLVGVVYELALVEATADAGSERDHSDSRSRSLALAFVGGNAAKARSDAGLTLRVMAQRVGLSFATVRQLEAGRQPRASTIRAYLDAFPQLAPQDLLPIEERAGSLTLDELWDYQVRLFGFCASEVERVLSVRLNGSTRGVTTTKGLRAEVADSTVALRVGFGRVVMSDRPIAPTLELLSSSEKTRVRTIRHRDGQTMHQLTFPAGLLSKGATYVRTTAWRPSFSMFEERAALKGGEAPFVAGASFVLVHPARRLRFRVELPRGYRPTEFRINAWPEAHVPHVDALGVLDVLPHLIHSTRFDESRPGVVIEVTKPLPGIRYAVSWILPSLGRGPGRARR